MLAKILNAIVTVLTLDFSVPTEIILLLLHLVCPDLGVVVHRVLVELQLALPADSVFPADVVFPLTLWSCVELDLEEIIALLTHCAELAGCLAGCGTATDAPLPC